VEVLKIAWSIVGDAHSGLPWTVKYVKVKAAMFSVYLSEQKKSIRDVTPVSNKRRKNGLRPKRKYFILLESETHEFLSKVFFIFPNECTVHLLRSTLKFTLKLLLHVSV
jgi:hypothetical protein